MEKKEYLELKELINHHMELYYDRDLPEISDFEYDNLMGKLKEMEKEHPEWISPDSPTQKIGGRPKREAGQKVTHNVPMLSIEDVFTKEDVLSWIRKVHLLHDSSGFSVETKIDGLSMTVSYEKNKEGFLELKMAETRGDGFIGEDVTLNALEIPDVKKEIHLPFDCERLELRGEVYMTEENFMKYNSLQESLGKKPAANPRNLAAGTLRQLDPAITRERGLSFRIFNVQDGPYKLMESHTDSLKILRSAGINTVFFKYCSTESEVISAIDEIAEERASFGFDLDGAVVKLDHISYRKDFPAGSKYSPGHIAYKYPPEERIVEMDDILVNVGRTGKLTFTGLFHDIETGLPARLCGTNVSRATLHNKDYIEEMHIGIGGHYILYKSGEIIPRLKKMVKEPREIFKAPKSCPVCGEELRTEAESADIVCLNRNCQAQLSQSISNFCSLDAMNIQGLGGVITDLLQKRGYIRSFSDIYRLRLHRESLIEEGIIGKEKNTDKILKAIEDSKNNEPVRLLTGLGIRNVGRSTARALMRNFSSITELSEAPAERLINIQDIGETTAQNIREFFSLPENQKLLKELKELGVNDKNKEERKEGRLSGLTITVTGTLKTLGRREVTELIEANGGRATGSVSGKTSYLLAGENAGSKLKLAQEKNIPIISEEEFLKLLE